MQNPTETWVRSLKAGDEVAILINHGRDYDLRKVDEVSTRKNAATQVVRIGQCWYDKYGNMNDLSLRPVTDEIRAKVQHSRLTRSCLRLAREIEQGLEAGRYTKNLSLDDLRTAFNALRAAEAVLQIKAP